MIICDFLHLSFKSVDHACHLHIRLVMGISKYLFGYMPNKMVQNKMLLGTHTCLKAISLYHITAGTIYTQNWENGIIDRNEITI